jgi:predicted nucleic acid-binding protein
MRTAIDSNVLFDLLFEDPVWSAPSRRALTAAQEQGALVACPVVSAELAAYFEKSDDLGRFLLDMTVTADVFTADALWQAGRAWSAYTLKRGQRVQCARCGRSASVQCQACGKPIAWRQHMISDFFIGAHALVQADVLLTRDRGYYKTYFPQLILHGP